MTVLRREPTDSEIRFRNQLQAARGRIAAAAIDVRRRKMADVSVTFGQPVRLEQIAAPEPPAEGVAGAFVACFGAKAADPNPVTMTRIIKAVCRECNVSLVELTGPRRNAKLVAIRQAAIWLCKNLTRSSFPAIGRKFGGRDHTTALHADRVAMRKIAEDEELRLPIMRVWAEMAADLGEDAPVVPAFETAPAE